MKDKIEKREPIWLALSEFYLDTELNENDYNDIANILMQSKIPLKQLKRIDLYEVFPILQPNLLSVAGVWSGFDVDWLRQKCTKVHLKSDSLLHKVVCQFFNLFFYWMRKSHWNEIENRFYTGINSTS